MKKFKIIAVVISILLFFSFVVLLTNPRAVEVSTKQVNEEMLGFMPDDWVSLQSILPFVIVFFLLYVIVHYIVGYWENISNNKQSSGENKVEKAKNFATLFSLIITFIILQFLMTGLRTISNGAWYESIQVIIFIFGLVSILMIIWSTIYWMQKKEEGFLEEIRKAHRLIMISLAIFFLSILIILALEILT